MSKKYKGKICVYCAVERSSGADHVFAREFFVTRQRANLPKVPACSKCNGRKADLEHYLTALLPFAGNHQDSSVLLSEEVPKRLAANRKLWQALSTGTQGLDIIERGATRNAMCLPFEAERLVALFEMVARGLIFHHWDVVIPQDHTVMASVVNPSYEPILEQLFVLEGGAYARGSPGNATFRYEGRQAVDYPSLTIWRFQIYGGIQLAGDPQLPGTLGSTLWVSSAPSGIENLLLEPN